MRRLLVFIVVLLVAIGASAASVTVTTNPNGSVTFAVTPAAGESIRNFEVWLPPGTGTGGQPGLPHIGDGVGHLPGWQAGNFNGPRGAGFVWNNPGTNGQPLGPDGGSFTVSPNFNASSTGAFAGTWATTKDGGITLPPRPGFPMPTTVIDFGSITDGGGHPIPLPIKWVRLDFPDHPGEPCTCAVGGEIRPRIVVTGLDGTETATWWIVASTRLERNPRERIASSTASRVRIEPEPYFGLDRLSPVPTAWGVYATPTRGELAGDAVDFTIGVRSESRARGRSIFVVAVVDLDGDGQGDTWTEPAEIRIQ